MDTKRRLLVGGICGVLVLGAALFIPGDESDLNDLSIRHDATIGASPSPGATETPRKRTVLRKVRQVTANAYSRVRRSVGRLF